MRLKNIMSLFICYVLFLSLLLSGCAKEQLAELPHIDRGEQLVETDSYFTLNKDRTERTVKGWKYEPLVTVTTFRILNSKVKFPKGQDYEHNVWFDAYREHLGIDLKYTFVCPSEDMWRRSGQAFAVDNLPDVMPVHDFTLFYKLADAERLCDLKPYYQRYASEDVKYWMEEVNGGIAYYSCYREEELNALAIPVKQEADNVMWIRNDWLNNVGLQWPNNFSETLNVMRAFRNNDPDMNGKKDTYGMALATDLDGLSVLSTALGALEGWIDINGGEDLDYGYIQPEWKEVCRVASELYKEGIIDPDFAKKTNAKIGNDYENEVLGLTADKTSINQMYKSVAANDECDWSCGYIKDEDGNIGVATAKTAIQQFTCVNKRTKYPEAAILLTNIWEPMAMGDEQDYRNFVGEDGVRYNSSDYTAFKFSWLENYDYQSYENISSDLVAGKEGSISKRDEFMYTMNGKLNELTANAESQGLYYADRSWGRVCDAWIKYGPNLHYKHIEYFAKIIIGKWDVDEGFDKWLRYFYKAGGQECIDGYNEWWDTEGKAGFRKFG